MRVMELKAFARNRWLRNHSRMRKAELVALLRNNPPPSRSSPPPQMSPSRAPPRGATWKPIDDRRPRQPSPREKDTFEQQEVSKSRLQVKSKLNDWYDWLINHVPKPIKDGASRAFKTFKDKIMGLYNRVTGSGNQTPEAQRSAGPATEEPKPFKPIEHEFGGSYRSYRINGRPKMDVDTFFNRIRKSLIGLIKRELNDLNSVKVQTTTWIRFVREDEEGQEKVELAFNSLMTSVYRGNDLDQIVGGMIANMKFQIENPALLNSRFVFDEVLYLDTNFHRLNLTRGSSYLPLSPWLAKQKAIINPNNDDNECFKWAVIAALEFPNIESHPERLSNLTKFSNNYDWSGLEFPVSTKDIWLFETNNIVSVNILAVEGREIYIHRKSHRLGPAGPGSCGDLMGHEINLLVIHEDGINHYTAIKSLSRLLSSKNSNTKCKQHFCTNCLQGFTRELSRDQHQVYCKTTKPLGSRCIERDRKLNSVMGRTNLRSHLSCMRISN